MNGDYSNNATFERLPREGDRALLFPENRMLEEALSRLDDVSLDKDNELYEELAEDLFPGKDEESLRELRRDAVRRVEEEIVSHAKFLLPIDVWEEDLTRLADGSQAVRDGVEYDKCVINREDAFFPEAAYLPLFTDWDSLYKGPYPGRVHAMVVTFDDCLRMIEEDGDAMGLAMNPGSRQQLFYDDGDLKRLAALRETLIEAGRVDGNWVFGPHSHRGPNVVLRGPQDRARLYLPSARDAATRATDDPLDDKLSSACGVCVCTVPLVPSTRTLMYEVFMALGRVCPSQMDGSGVWEVYAKVDCDTLQRIGRIFWDDADGGAPNLAYLSDGYPATDLIYCEHLSKDESAILEESTYAQLTSGYTQHLRNVLRYCALDNTYLTGCSYTYSGEEAAYEYANNLAERDANKPSIRLLTIPLMLLGALLMYVTRVALWPGALAVLGCAFFLLVFPVVGFEVALPLILKPKATRIVREQMGDGRLPSAGQHHARFSMRPGFSLYRDETREVKDDNSIVGAETKHYLFCFMRNGVKVPIPKSIL